MFLLFSQENEAWWFPECLVQGVNERSIKPDGTVGVEAFPGESE